MVQYNPKDWFTFIFRFHKADTVRQLMPMMFGMSIYSFIVVLLELQYKILNEEYAKNILQMHTLLGLAISMLLVFRTNTAYDRWWEGRKLWGSLVNASRNFSLKINNFLSKSDTEAKLVVAKHLSTFATSLHFHLRKEAVKVELADYINTEKIDNKAAPSVHVPAQIINRLIEDINHFLNSGKLSGDQFIVLNSELPVFMDVCGACERIKNTPIPFSYSVFIKKIIFFYTMTLPFGFAFSLGYLTIPVTVFIFYVLASLEMIAEEIEDPFSGDGNDIPTNKIAETIEKNVMEILA